MVHAMCAGQCKGPPGWLGPRIEPRDVPRWGGGWVVDGRWTELDKKEKRCALAKTFKSKDERRLAHHQGGDAVGFRVYLLGNGGWSASRRVLAIGKNNDLLTFCVTKWTQLRLAPPQGQGKGTSVLGVVGRKWRARRGERNGEKARGVNKQGLYFRNWVRPESRRASSRSLSTVESRESKRLGRGGCEFASASARVRGGGAKVRDGELSRAVIVAGAL